MGRRVLLLLAVLGISLNITAQDSANTGLIQVPDRFTNRVNQTINGIDHQLTKQSDKYLKSLSKQEDRIMKKLARLDSSKASKIFTDSKATYEQLSQKLATTNGKMNKALSGEYLPYLDSLSGSLGFLKEAKNIISQSKDIQQKLGTSLEQVKQLQNKLQQADEIKGYLQQRQKELTELLSVYTKLPNGLGKELSKYQQQVFYYGRQIKEYKEALNDPDKLVKRVFSVLRQLPKFKEFMGKHSILSGLFASAEASTIIDPTLPTRDQVMELVQQRIGSGGQGGQQAFSQQLQQAQNEMAKLKSKLSEIGLSPDGDMNMPDFKPNTLRTKKFMERIEFGGSVQSNRKSNYFPVSSDISFSVGYRLDERRTFGVSVGGKVGWGSSFKQIHITGEGVGMRFYIEWQAKGNIWLTGGAGLNYHKPIESLTIFKNYSTWNKSAVAGISRKYKIGKKLKGNMQVLYDFLHRNNVPVTEALIWQVGYNF